jgi:hypothetical protein
MRRLCCAVVAFWVAVGVSAARCDQPRLAEGTLLFLENCSSVVEWSTRGEIAHVALAFSEGGTAYVYEATPAKVRRVTLDEYQNELARLNKKRDEDERVRMIALAARKAYAPEEVEKMRAYLDRQLGRRYSVKNYVRGKPYDGIHCAELASSTLNESGRYAFRECHKLSPLALYEAVRPTHEEPRVIATPPLLETDRWTVRTRRSAGGWFSWCGWSCREMWLFLW